MVTGTWVFGDTDKRFAAIRAIRDAVFVQEQGYSTEEEYDEFDAVAWHVLIQNDDMPVATGRLFLEEGLYTLGRICVLAAQRGQGYGDLAVRMLLDRAIKAGAPDVHIHSQLPAAGLYERFGFVAQGPAYHLPGDTRAHINMYAAAEDIVFPRACGHLA